jgi:hypothetical protein
VQAAPGQRAVRVTHLELRGGAWTAEVDGRRLRGSALLYTHAGEQVLTLWQAGRSYEFRCVVCGALTGVGAAAFMCTRAQR